MRDVRRKIVKPPEPALEAPEVNRHDSNNGSRLHYPAKINSMLIGNVAQPLDQELEIHYKQCKADSNKDAEVPETLAKAEVVFSELVYALLGKTMTAKPYLAVDPAAPNKIVGLATDQYNDFVTIDKSDDTIWSEMDKRRLGRVSMMLLVTSDDDAHEQNMGSRFIRDPRNPDNLIRVPFHIDHDMNWYDQLFSRFGAGNRYLLHPFDHNRHDFDSEDIDNFPMTKKFRAHHWMSRPNSDIDRKGYNATDKRAMMDMKDDLEFQKGAYFQLLSFILLPKDLLRAMLLQHIEETDPLFPLVLNTWMEQQANLKAAALGSEQFRLLAFNNHTNRDQNRQEFRELIEEYRNDINQHSPDCIAPIDSDALFDSFIPTVTQSMQNHDTELHAAIRSESFRFDESMQRFGKHLRSKNRVGEGDTPIELAVKLGNDAAQNNQWDKVEYFKRVARFLADQKKGPALPAEYSALLQRKQPHEAFNALPTSYEKLKVKLSHNQSIEDDIRMLTPLQYKNILAEALRDRQHNKVSVELINGFANLPQAAAVQTLERCLLEALSNTLKALNDDTSMTLKMKKNAAILAFKAVTPHLKSGDDFNALRAILDAPENKFIQQLTSRFEIVRHLRGLHGVTSTYKTIAHSINTRMQARKKEIGREDVDTKDVINGVQRQFSKELHTFFGRHTCRTQVETFEHRVAREQPALVI